MPFTAEQEAVLAAIADKALIAERRAVVVAEAQAEMDAIEQTKTERHDALYVELEALDAEVRVVEVVKAEALGKLTPVKEV